MQLLRPGEVRQILQNFQPILSKVASPLPPIRYDQALAFVADARAHMAAAIGAPLARARALKPHGDEWDWALLVAAIGACEALCRLMTAGVHVSADASRCIAAAVEGMREVRGGGMCETCR